MYYVIIFDAVDIFSSLHGNANKNMYYFYLLWNKHVGVRGGWEKVGYRENDCSEVVCVNRALCSNCTYSYPGW